MSTNDSEKRKNEDKKYELDHEYDGIQEYDYPAPAWWQIIFFATIVWGIGYFIYYSVYDGETLRHSLNRQLVEIERERLKTASNGPSESELTALVSDANSLKVGRETFMGKCSSCHGEHGQGMIGPNLTDRFWIHGNGSISEIFKTVDKGVPDKGMPPWGSILPATEMKSVVAYVKTLQGSNPANPKAPQGVEVKP